jgi:hypothetical protein
MNGDFKTDITRDTFRPFRHFSRVLMQQGRVQLDADWNEQVDILLHYLRTFIGDVIGPYPGAGAGDSFQVAKPGVSQPGPNQLSLQSGHYYVDGILCENESGDYVYKIPESLRPTPTPSSSKKKSGQPSTAVPYFIYLNVWEREVTYLEDVHIREVALGGPDTTTRSKVVWKVRAANLAGQGPQPPDPPVPTDEKYKVNGVFQLHLFTDAWTTQLQIWKDVGGDHGHLMAQTVEPPATGQEPCAIPATSQYRGVENQLYRVEIHDGSYDSSGNSIGPTFKWSRENGTVVFPIKGKVAGGTGLTSLTLTLGNFGRDDSRFGLHVDNWVEIVDTSHGIEQKPGPLMKVASIDPATRQVTLTSQNGITFPDDGDPDRVLLLRRWDYKRGDTSQPTTPQFADDDALKIVANQALILEDGIEITFVEDTTAPTYRSGDYWLIAARTAHGTIENNGVKLPPHGVKHHYAPLAYVTLTDGMINATTDLYDLRRTINGIATIPTA